MNIIIVLLKTKNARQYVHVYKKNIQLLCLIIVECDRGSYGIGCNETCGQCRDVSQCSNVNGSCLTGCGAGFIGDLCEISKYANIKTHVVIVLQLFFQRPQS